MIREARHSDIEALLDLENRSFPGDRLSRRSLAHLIKKGNATILIDDADGRMRGYALVLYSKGTSLARLYSLAVDSDSRGLGLGRGLLEAAEKDALENQCVMMRLEVRKDNHNAIALYWSCGYRLIGTVSDYYEDHMSALRFEKRLFSQAKPEDSEVIDGNPNRGC